MTENEIIQSLIEIADEFDEECDRAWKVGYCIEFAMGPYVQVDVNLLRQLRSLRQEQQIKPQTKQNCYLFS